MLTVLWVLSAAGSLTTVALLAGRNAAGATRNRVEWQRARWRALGCARRAQSGVDASLRRARTAERAATIWRTLSVVVDSSSVIAGCDITLEAAGTRLDVNAATPEMLERLFVAMQQSVDARQLSVDIVAARDSAPLSDVGALRRLRPDINWLPYDSLLSVEPGRIALSAASSTVLQAIPGITPEIADAIVGHRANHPPLNDLKDVLALVPRGSAAELEDRFQDVAHVATTDPDAWLLRSTARSGTRAVSAVVEWRMIRQNDRVAVVRSTIR